MRDIISISIECNTAHFIWEENEHRTCTVLEILYIMVGCVHGGVTAQQWA